jgi:hypothetical protein
MIIDKIDYKLILLIIRIFSNIFINNSLSKNFIRNKILEEMFATYIKYGFQLFQ